MKVIAFEGIDGSGKTTQARILADTLRRRGYDARYLSFPRYDDEASVLVRRYLNGEYGEDPDQVDPYSAALFYAMDRYDYFRHLEEAPQILVVDRYTPSNMIHQSSKLEGPEREAFNAWLEDLEYGRLKIPRPDQVIFLDLPTELSEELLRERSENTDTKLDIHERDRDYLNRSHECARDLAESRGWRRIDCAADGKLLDIDSVSAAVLEQVELDV